jgi:hypothetical protein
MGNGIDLGTFKHWASFLCSKETDAVFYADDPSKVTEAEREQAEYLDDLSMTLAKDGDDLGAQWRRSIGLLEGRS